MGNKQQTYRERLRAQRGEREPETGPPLLVTAGELKHPPTLREQIQRYVGEAMALTNRMPDATVEEAFDLDEDGEPEDELGPSIHQLHDTLSMDGGAHAEGASLQSVSDDQLLAELERREALQDGGEDASEGARAEPPVAPHEGPDGAEWGSPPGGDGGTAP